MGTNITLTSADGFEFSAYRAEPDGVAKGGVVVVQGDLWRQRAHS